MQPRFAIKVLPWEAQVEGECALIGGVFIGDVVAKRIGIVPSPYLLPRRVGDAARAVEVVAVDVVGLKSREQRAC
ncbi:MAG: hypothetical protein PHU06_14285 [Gallionella sp.]|nr:hypothetical protein [Gallionella sp.]